MPQYLSPGVYVEEIDTGNKPIEGVSTSTAGFLGVTERGPVNVPMLVTSYGEFTRLFGDKLPQDTFSNSNGPHWALPQAVEGFFTNGGKEMYVTRVLDTQGATYAQFTLHDRGTPTSVFSMLLRNAPEGTGTVVSTMPLYLVSADLTGGAALNVGQDIRLGDGSASEYRTVDNPPPALVTGATRMDVDLDFPLSRSHDAATEGTVDEIPRTVVGGTFTLQSDSKIGDESITINGAIADITGLVTGVAAGELLELAIPVAPPPVVAEYRYVISVTQLTATQAIVMLDSPLQIAHAHGPTVVTRLDPTVASTTANLATSAAAGDRVAFVTPPIPGVFAEDSILLFNKAGVPNREARRIGSLYSIEVEGGSVGEYPAGSVVEPVVMADEHWTVTTAFAAGATFPVASITPPVPAEAALLTPGITLTMGTGGSLETVTVTNVAGGNVTVTPASVGHGVGEPVFPSFSLMHLTANAPAGAGVIGVDNRQTLQVGDVIRIDVPPNEEFATILAIPNGSLIAPDSGMVILDGPLNFSHAGPITTPATPGAGVRRETAPVVDTTKPPSTLVFDVAGNAEMMILSHGTGYASGDHVRITTSGGEVEYHQIQAAPVALTPELVYVTKATEGQYSAGTIVAQRDPEALVQALDMGSWGNRLRISVQDEPVGLVSRTTLSGPPIGTTQIRLASPAGVESGTVLELLDPAKNDAVIDVPLKVDFVDRTANYLITLAAPGLTPTQMAAIAAATTPLGVHSREFRLTVSLLHQPDPARPQKDLIVIDSEIFRSLSMDPRHSHYFDTIIGDINGPLRLEDRRPEGQSSYIRVSDLAATTAIAESVRLGPETLVDISPTGKPRPAMHPLEGGDDSVLTLDDSVYIGADNVQPEDRTGLWSLVNIDDISIIGCPGRTSATMQGALISQCENLLYRFAVLDSTPPPDDSMNDVQFQRQQYDTKYAALYYPWLLIPDPFPANLSNISNVPIPPSGHIAGIYANVDNTRGVHKAPANEVVNGIVGLQRIINGSEQDILNPFPVNINVIRDFRSNDRGIRVWGARVVSSDSDYKYVNVRRLLIFLEKSLNQGLQWVVFEPNAQPLWARVVRSISAFLTVVWRNGALEGTKKEEAFFVKCDNTTMTQTDIDEGRLICYVGVAPVMPAEFVIIRIGLWTANSSD